MVPGLQPAVIRTVELAERPAFGVLPEFIVRDALAGGRLEHLLPEWSLPSSSVHWVMLPGGQRPKRVEVLGEFLAASLAAPGRRGR